MIFNLKFIVDGSIEVIFLEIICLMDPGLESKKICFGLK